MSPPTLERSCHTVFAAVQSKNHLEQHSLTNTHTSFIYVFYSQLCSRSNTQACHPSFHQSIQLLFPSVNYAFVLVLAVDQLYVQPVVDKLSNKEEFWPLPLCPNCVTAQIHGQIYTRCMFMTSGTIVDLCCLGVKYVVPAWHILGIFICAHIMCKWTLKQIYFHFSLVQNRPQRGEEQLWVVFTQRMGGMKQPKLTERQPIVNIGSVGTSLKKK